MGLLKVRDLGVRSHQVLSLGSSSQATGASVASPVKWENRVLGGHSELADRRAQHRPAGYEPPVVWLMLHPVMALGGRRPLSGLRVGEGFSGSGSFLPLPSPSTAGSVLTDTIIFN